MMLKLKGKLYVNKLIGGKISCGNTEVLLLINCYIFREYRVGYRYLAGS